VIAALGTGSDFGVSIEYTVEQPNILGTAGTECRDHRLRLMVKVHDHIVEPEPGDIFRDITDERLAEERDRRLGPIDR